MRSRSARFYSDGLKLAGTLFVPDDYEPGQKRPAVLICHGRFAIKEWVPSRWTPHFLAAGYVCMVFDYRNLGESEGTPGRIIPDEEVRDARHALTYLQCQPERWAGGWAAAWPSARRRTTPASRRWSAPAAWPMEGATAGSA